ncbi:MAG: Crp/Fnr family transcriptional regulator [Coriobacteriales bacterium]|jgi:CRP-like cAMP-binding protein|nr:Crp/Fnr family transcriptional regulator [Coriobacteriales bacterium]
MAGRQKNVEAIRDELRACSFFKVLTEDELMQLAQASYVAEKQAGAFLLHAGDEATHYYLLLKGMVAHYYLKPNGKHFLMQAHVEGALFFVSLALSQTRHGGYLQALENTTLVCIPAALTLRLVKNNTAFAQNLLHTTVNDNLRLNDQVSNFLVDARTRFSRFLFRIALESGKQVNGSIQFDLGMSKSGIAAALDLTPETLSRTIAQMKDDGIIEMSHSAVAIKSVRGLVQLSESLL